MSRLNYAKMYTVEHNIKVCFIGMIHKASVKEFKAAYKRVQNDSGSLTGLMVDDEMYRGDDGVVTEEKEEDIHPDNMKYKY